MKRYASMFLVALFLFIAPALHAQQTKSSQMTKLFRDVVAKSSQHTVRINVAGKEAALGIVVGADGWILTKHSELKGDKITCKLPDDEELDAQVVNFDTRYDLAMLKIEAKDLTPVVWCDSKICRTGHWVASPGAGADPVGLGVLSVAARKMRMSKYEVHENATATYLGVQFELTEAGAKIEEVVAKSPAEKAGLKAGDQILAFNGDEVEIIEDIRALLTKRKPNDQVKLKITRDSKEQELQATLGTPPGSKAGKSRGDIQNSMGSKLSERRTGFPVILQHDSVLKPTDCGGPLVNLDGKVIGINICRAGRTESYAIPSEAVRPLLEKLKMAKKDKAP